MIALWAAAAYLAKTGKFHWIATLPATFMTAVVTSYIIVAPEGFRLPYIVGIAVGLAAAVGLFIAFYTQIAVKQRNTLMSEA
jgi:carbon starvation protein CstA